MILQASRGNVPAFRHLAMNLGILLTIFLRRRLVGSDAIGNRYYEAKSKRRGSLRARRWVVYAGENVASAGCTTRLMRQFQKPARRRVIARQTTTIAAVIEPLRTAITSPGRQAVSEVLPQSWQRYSRQGLVRRMS